MKNCLIILVCLGCMQEQQAQINSIDSLKTAISNSQSAAEKLKLFQELSETYRVSSLFKNADSAKQYAEYSLTLARELKDQRAEVKSLVLSAKSVRTETEPVKAIEYFQEALRLAEKIKDTSGIISGLNGYALLYYHKQEFRQELALYWKVADLARRVKDDNALRSVTANIGKTYMLLNEMDSAEFYLKKAMAMKMKDEDPFTMIHMGRLETIKQNYPVAFEYIKKALAIYQSRNDNFRISMCNYDLGDLCETLNKNDSALFYYHRAYDYGRLTADSLYTISGVGESIALLYEKMNRLPEALRYFKLSESAKYRIKDEENLAKLLNLEFQEKERKREIEKVKAENTNNTRLFILAGGLFIFLLVSFFLYRNNLNRKKTNDLLKKQNVKIENAFAELKRTQTQLIQSEKMASLGQLTAGIAHEIQNPLNFVNNFSELSKELLHEMSAEFDKGNFVNAKAIVADLVSNQEKINHHGKRADAIVKGMLQHSGKTTGRKEAVDIRTLAEEYWRLAYIGMRSKDNSFDARLKLDFEKNIEKVELIPQEIGRVLLNIYNNAFFALSEKKKLMPGFNPEVTVTIVTKGGIVEIAVKDNGDGIPEKIMDKIFQPFFTTKPTGQGTGLGLSLAYDIIRAHGGDIRVNPDPGKGAEFIITLPFR